MDDTGLAFELAWKCHPFRLLRLLVSRTPVRRRDAVQCNHYLHGLTDFHPLLHTHKGIATQHSFKTR